MKAKSVLLTVPLAVSALTFLTLPANAVCWSWKPCADQPRLRLRSTDGIPGRAATVAGRRQCASGLDCRSRAKRRRHRAQPGRRQQLKPAKKPAATATAAPQPAPAAKPKPAPAPAQAAAPPPAAPAPAQAKAAPPPAPAPVQQAAPQPAPAPVPGESHAAARTGTSASTCACPGESSAASAASSATGTALRLRQPRHRTSGSCTQTATRSGGSAGYCAGHDADGARHGDHAGDPRIGERSRRQLRRTALSVLTR